jgi:hypothetical protein
MKASSSGLPLARLIALAVLLAAMLPGAAAAQSLDALRVQGVVGERFDGTAVVRSATASPQVRNFVADVNAQRTAIYKERAAQQGVTVAQVGKIYARQIYDALPAGAWFLDESGAWRQK